MITGLHAPTEQVTTEEASELIHEEVKKKKAKVSKVKPSKLGSVLIPLSLHPVVLFSPSLHVFTVSCYLTMWCFWLGYGNFVSHKGKKTHRDTAVIAFFKVVSTAHFLSFIYLVHFKELLILHLLGKYHLVKDSIGISGTRNNRVQWVISILHHPSYVRGTTMVGQHTVW